MQNMNTNVLVDLRKNYFYEGHYQKLKRTSFPKNSSKGNKNCCCSEVCSEHSVIKEIFGFRFGQKSAISISFTNFQKVRFVSGVTHMIDLLHDANCPVSGNGGSYNNGPLCTESR